MEVNYPANPPLYHGLCASQSPITAKPPVKTRFLPKLRGKQRVSTTMAENGFFGPSELEIHLNCFDLKTLKESS
jgi:hypothetical protein